MSRQFLSFLGRDTTMDAVQKLGNKMNPGSKSRPSASADDYFPRNENKAFSFAEALIRNLFLPPDLIREDPWVTLDCSEHF
jgi:hypothetical protein